MSQELARQEVPQELSVPGPAAIEAFEGAPLSPAVWSMYAQIAKTIAKTEFVPAGLRGSEPGVLACMLYGHAQGLDPMIALSEISMIDGKPAMSAELLTAKVRQAGHAIEREEIVKDGELFGITAHGERRDGGTDSFTFTLDMARRAGLMTKKNWQNYPEAMLWARAASQLARILFGDVFLGMSVYVPDELGATTDEEGKPVDVEPAGEEALAEVEPGATPVVEPTTATGPEEAEEVGEEVGQEAAAAALEESFPTTQSFPEEEGLPPLTREMVMACDNRPELVALAERYGVEHGKRDPIATLTEKLARRIKEREPQAEVVADGSENTPSAPPEEGPIAKPPPTLETESKGMTLPDVEPEPEPVEPMRDAMLGRVQHALDHVKERYPNSQLSEERVLTASTKQFDRPVESLDELTGKELVVIWDALPANVQEFVIEQEQEVEA